jgi:hypothetical protein
MQGATERTAPPRFGATCCFLDSPCRHFGCRRRFPFLAGYARDNPVYHVAKSSASNNLVRRIYARARPKIPFNLNSGAWKTGPNLPHGLIRQGTPEAHRSPRCSAKSVYSLNSLQRTRNAHSLGSSAADMPDRLKVTHLGQRLYIAAFKPMLTKRDERIGR